ncbi:MAG: hypothetical protein OXE52_18370 [Chloroflexi bacterium]|nr:hypothetical protein [Chloroflexota bacterium]
MKARAFALMLIAVLIWTMAAAGIAEDIDNCCFVDRQCSSDQDWINGWHAYENNQCSAPAQSRAQTSSLPTGGTPAQIDNCCFVDRQCSTDQDWAAGYYAFQNNQCSAPGQSSAPTSSQPTGGTTAQIDNCCFVDRQCSSDLEWAAGYHAFQNNQCRAPGQSPASATSPSDSGVILRTASGIVMGYRNGRSILPSTGPSILPAPGQIISTHNCCQENWQCNSDQDQAAGYRALQARDCALPGLISVVGPPDFVDQYERALDLLKNRLPQRYNYVLDGVDKVENREEQGGDGNINPLRRTFFVGQGGYYDHEHSPRVEEVSTVLVHEACHVHRANAGYRIRNGCDRIREETFCTGMQVDVLIELNVEPPLIEIYRDLAAGVRSGEVNVLFEGEEC